MADETTSSTISELYTEIIAEAMFVANEKSLMRGLVKNYTIAGGGKSVEVPIYAAVSAAAVSEAADLSNTAVNPSSVTITASEVGIMTTLTDLARNSSSRNVGADFGRLFGEAIAIISGELSKSKLNSSSCFFRLISAPKKSFK